MNRRQIIQLASLGAFGNMFPNLKASVSEGQNKVVAKKNLVIFTNDMGYYQKFFLPEKADDLDSSKLVSLLKPHYNELTMLQEISQPEIGHGHGRNKGMLTLNTHQTNGPYISLDQFARERIVQKTRFKSVNMAEGGVVWDKSSVQVPSLMNIGPKEIFKKLFTKSFSTEESEKKLAALRSYKIEMGQSPFTNDQYKRCIRELEEEIATDLIWEKKPIPKVKCDTALHLRDAHNRGSISPFPQQLEFIHLGLKHKRGQIFTVAPPYIDKIENLGGSSSYHGCGHQTANGEKSGYKAMLEIERYIFESISGFITSLKKSKLLDDTIILVLGSFDNPGRHKRDFTPAVLMGGGFKHQGIVKCKETYRLSQLYVSVLHQMGIDVGEFSSFKGDMDKELI